MRVKEWEKSGVPSFLRCNVYLPFNYQIYMNNTTLDSCQYLELLYIGGAPLPSQAALYFHLYFSNLKLK